MPMKNPPHPGGFVLRQCIEPLGLTITDAAAALGVTRTTLSELVNGKRGISPEMAVRLSKVFGGSAEAGLRSRRSTIWPRSARTALSSDGWHWLSRFQKRLFAQRPFPWPLFSPAIREVVSHGGGASKSFPSVLGWATQNPHET